MFKWLCRTGAMALVLACLLASSAEATPFIFNGTICVISNDSTCPSLPNGHTTLTVCSNWKDLCCNGECFTTTEVLHCANGIKPGSYPFHVLGNIPTGPTRCWGLICCTAFTDGPGGNACRPDFGDCAFTTAHGPPAFFVNVGWTFNCGGPPSNISAGDPIVFTGKFNSIQPAAAGAPEIAPSAAVAPLFLLVGAVFVVVDRRLRRPALPTSR